MQLIWTFVFFGIIAGGICRIADHPFNRRWMTNGRPKSNQERIVCETQQCKELAKTLIESMNHTVDPCEDFYEYACGNWKKHNPLPEGVVRWNLPHKIQMKVVERLKAIVKEGPQPDDIHGAKIAKRAFETCMDTGAMDKAGLQPLVSTLWRAGGWPMIMDEDEWDENIYKWQNVDDYYALLIGENSLHSVHVDIDYWNDGGIYLFIKTPDTLASMYKLLNIEDLAYDYYDGEEGSQERGSEEREDIESIDNEDDHMEEEPHGGHKFGKRSVSTRRILDRVMQRIRAKKRIERAKGRADGTKKMKERAKRSLVNARSHNKKQRKKVTMPAVKSSNHKQTSRLHSVKKISNAKSFRGSERIVNTNNDLYFNDDIDEGNNDENNRTEENGNDRKDGDNDGNEGENEDTNDYDYGSDDYERNDQDGSGSGDHEQDDQASSGSGDDEWNNEYGSGSGDDEWNNDYGSGSGDDSGENDESGDSTNSDESEGDSDSEEDGDSGEERRQRTEQARAEYAEYILNVSLALAKARGVSVSRERLSKDIVDLIEFQIEILEYSFMFENEKRIRLRSLQRRYDALQPKTKNGKINWIKKVQDLFGSGGMEIAEKEYVTVESFDYLMALRSLLDKTPSRTIVNYIHWNFISRVLKATTKEMRKLHHGWDGTEMDNKTRMKDCVEEIRAKYIAGYEYVRRYVPDEILQTASDMVDDIQKEVEQEIKKSPWMDAEIRHIILDKLVYMKKVIGYPNSYRNRTIMKEHFKGLSVTKSHYENSLSIMRYLKWENLKIFYTNEYPQDVDMNPLIVNAFFSPVENAIEITAADFQKPLYDVNQPWYTNYGIIGLVMSHEVNHGFDNSGRLFDKTGKLAEWSSEMLEEYDKRAQCFIDQFTRYSVVENKTANVSIQDYGEQTAGENIADSMGLNSVFKAYQRRLRECDKPDPMLPGLEDLSNEQLFFLSFGNTWCEVTDPEKLPALVKRDPHSVGQLRVIGSVSNSEDFAKAYNCPTDSPMNPKNKCNIWN